MKKIKIIMFGTCMYFFNILSDNFLTSTIILLVIFIRGVHVREKGGKEREREKKKMRCT